MPYRFRAKSAVHHCLPSMKAFAAASDALSSVEVSVSLGGSSPGLSRLNSSYASSNSTFLEKLPYALQECCHAFIHSSQGVSTKRLPFVFVSRLTHSRVKRSSFESTLNDSASNISGRFVKEWRKLSMRRTSLIREMLISIVEKLPARRLRSSSSMLALIAPHSDTALSDCDRISPPSSLTLQVRIQIRLPSYALSPKRAGPGSCSGKVNNSTRLRVRPFGFEPEVPPDADNPTEYRESCNNRPDHSNGLFI